MHIYHTFSIGQNQIEVLKPQSSITSERETGRVASVLYQIKESIWGPCCRQSAWEVLIGIDYMPLFYHEWRRQTTISQDDKPEH